MGLPQYKLSARLGESVESSTTQLTLGNWRISNESNNRIIELVCVRCGILSIYRLSRSSRIRFDSIHSIKSAVRTRLPRLPMPIHLIVFPLYGTYTYVRVRFLARQPHMHLAILHLSDLSIIYLL